MFNCELYFILLFGIVFMPIDARVYQKPLEDIGKTPICGYQVRLGNLYLLLYLFNVYLFLVLFVCLFVLRVGGLNKGNFGKREKFYFMVEI